MKTWLRRYRDAALDLDRGGLAGRPDDVTPLINGIIRSHLLVGPDDIVVDFGCGDGSLLASLDPCRRRIGLVPSSEEVTALQRLHAGTDIEFHQAAAPSLPLPDAIASRVVANGVLLLLGDISVVRATLAELHRISRPDAICYVGEMPSHPRDWTGRLARPFEIVETHGLAELMRRGLKQASRRFGSRSRPSDSSGERPLSYVYATPTEFGEMARSVGFNSVAVHRHDVRRDGRRVEYPRNRFNYVLQR